MAEISLDSKEFDDTLKEDGKDQARLQPRQENENEKKSNLQSMQKIILLEVYRMY